MVLLKEALILTGAELSKKDDWQFYAAGVAFLHDHIQHF